MPGRVARERGRGRRLPGHPREGARQDRARPRRPAVRRLPDLDVDLAELLLGARIARGREQGRAVRQDLQAVRVPVAPGVGVELDGRGERGPAVVGGGDPHVGRRLVGDVDVGAAGAHADPRLVRPRLAGHLDRRAPRGRVVRRLAEHHVVAVHERGVERAVGRHLEDRVVLPLHARALTEVGLGPPADAVVARDAHVHRDARALLACLRAAEPVVHRVDERSARIRGDRGLPRVLDAELDLAGPSGRGHGRRHRASFRSGDGTLPRLRHGHPDVRLGLSFRVLPLGLGLTALRGVRIPLRGRCLCRFRRPVRSERHRGHHQQSHHDDQRRDPTLAHPHPFAERPQNRMPGRGAGRIETVTRGYIGGDSGFGSRRMNQMCGPPSGASSSTTVRKPKPS